MQWPKRIPRVQKNPNSISSKHLSKNQDLQIPFENSARKCSNSSNYLCHDTGKAANEKPGGPEDDSSIRLQSSSKHTGWHGINSRAPHRSYPSSSSPLPHFHVSINIPIFLVKQHRDLYQQQQFSNGLRKIVGVPATMTSADLDIMNHFGAQNYL